MARPKVTITNADKNGKVSDSWYVRVGNAKWKSFSQAEWVKGGIQYLNDMLRMGSK